MDLTYQRWFEELLAELDKVLRTRKRGVDEYGDAYDNVAEDRATTWIVRTESLLARVCGSSSEHLKHFIKGQEWQSFETGFSRLQRLSAIFQAAKADFDGGYLSSLRSIVQAEVFSNQLEQARELLEKNYRAPAAVVTGVVLETALRELCDRNTLASGKIDRMNADLAKAGLYSLLQQKRITVLAQIRNDAAHGNWDQFTEADVRSMINEVESFIVARLA